MAETEKKSSSKKGGGGYTEKAVDNVVGTYEERPLEAALVEEQKGDDQK